MSQKNEKKLSLSSALPTSRKRHRESSNEAFTQQASSQSNQNNSNRQQRQQQQHQQQQQQQQNHGGRGRGGGGRGGRGRRRGNHQRRNNHNRNRPHYRHQDDLRQEDQRGKKQQQQQVNTTSASSMTSHDIPTRRRTDDAMSGDSGPQRSIEGWLIIVTGVHEEAQEEDIQETFSEYGKINHIKLNLDTRTGYCKGYVLIAYTEKSEAQDAINALHGKEFLGKAIRVDWAFVGGGSADNDATIRPNKKMKNRGVI